MTDVIDTEIEERDWKDFVSEVAEGLGEYMGVDMRFDPFVGGISIGVSGSKQVGIVYVSGNHRFSDLYLVIEANKTKLDSFKEDTDIVVYEESERLKSKVNVNVYLSEYQARATLKDFFDSCVYAAIRIIDRHVVKSARVFDGVNDLQPEEFEYYEHVQENGDQESVLEDKFSRITVEDDQVFNWFHEDGIDSQLIAKVAVFENNRLKIDFGAKPAAEGSLDEDKKDRVVRFREQTIELANVTLADVLDDDEKECLIRVGEAPAKHYGLELDYIYKD